MRITALWHRRELVIPTVWGWTLLFAFGVGVCVWGAKNMHSFLAIEKPVGARLLIVEGWMAPEELDQAFEIYRKRPYEYVITTGGNLPPTLYFEKPVSHAVLAREYLLRKGVPPDRITASPTPRSPQERTYLSAVMARSSIARGGLSAETVDVFSAGVHSRRTHLIYRMVFEPDIRVGIISSKPTDYDPNGWWQSSYGAKMVIMEGISWLWTVLFFNPPPRGSHEEKWGSPRISAPTG